MPKTRDISDVPNWDIERCDTCRFWDREHAQEEFDKGQCRRHAPRAVFRVFVERSHVPIEMPVSPESQKKRDILGVWPHWCAGHDIDMKPSHSLAEWPTTFMDDGCGEHAPKILGKK